MDAPPSNNSCTAGEYAFGTFRLDVAARALWRNGFDAVPLPSRAFDSLVYLVEHRDRLVSKNELIDAVWSDVVVTDDSLIHAISVMRRALGDDPNEPRYVQTVPRRGYRFVAPVERAARATAAPEPVVGDTDTNSIAASAAPSRRQWSMTLTRGRVAGAVAAIALSWAPRSS